LTWAMLAKFPSKKNKITLHNKTQKQSRRVIIRTVRHVDKTSEKILENARSGKRQQKHYLPGSPHVLRFKETRPKFLNCWRRPD
jgi:hypothetical protein